MLESRCLTDQIDRRPVFICRFRAHARARIFFYPKIRIANNLSIGRTFRRQSRDDATDLFFSDDIQPVPAILPARYDVF